MPIRWCRWTTWGQSPGLWRSSPPVSPAVYTKLDRAISPNDPKAVRLDELGYTDLDDSFEAMKVRARDHHFAFPYLYDGETQSTAHAYGVLATPHVFIFDADRKLRYVGRFDDSEVKEVKSHDARNAVDALLANGA